MRTTSAPMPDREIVLAEQSSGIVPAGRLTRAAVSALTGVPGDLFRVRALACDDEIRVGSVAGCVQLDNVVVRVAPSLFPDGAAVLAWLAYAAGAPVEIDQHRSWQVGGDSLPDLVISALVEECERLSASGLRLDYQREQVVDTVLRGRLDLRAQLTRRYGQVDRLHLDRFGRRDDIWENLVCRVALEVAGRVGSSAALRTAARGLAARFPTATVDRVWARRRLRTARYTRLNARYRAAHVWAGLLLDDGGIDDLVIDGPWQAGNLLVRTDRIWERAVARACRDAGEGRAAAAIRILGDEGSLRTLRPDAGIRRGERRVPVDAKYKSYGRRKVSNSDVHQLLTYASACAAPGEDPTAVLVHPVVGPSTRRAVDVRAGRRLVGSIAVIGLDTRLPPAEAARWLGASVVDQHREVAADPSAWSR